MSATARIDSAYIPVAPTARPRRRLLRPVARLTGAVFLVLAAILIAGSIGLGLYSSAHGGRVYEGVSVAGIRVGGMTRAEAQVALADRFDTYLSSPLTLTAADRSFQATPSELGARIDADASIGTAEAYGRNGSYWDRSRDWVRGVAGGAEVPPRVVFERAVLDTYLRSIAPEIVRAPIDAEIAMSTGGEPVLVPDLPGISLDLTASAHAVVRAVEGLETSPVPLATRAKPAPIAASDLQESLAGARAAVKAALVIGSDEGSWTVSRDDLKTIVSARAGQQTVQINQEPLREMIAGIATQVDRSAADAGITVDDNGALVVAPGTDAARVDVAGTVTAVVTALEAGKHVVPLAVKRAQPVITNDMAAAAATRAEALIADGMKLSWKGGGAELGRDDLLRALTITPRPGEREPFAFGMDKAAISEMLTGVAEAETVDVPATDARFRLVDGRVTLASEAKKGRQLDIDGGVKAVVAAFGRKQPVAKLTVADVKPTWTSADLGKISVGDDILGDSMTYYGTSSEPRRQNVERATQLEEGWLVPPGGIFSYDQNVGDIDKASGFATGFGIVANEGGGVTTAPVIGGGICQVSTTIFQAAFWAGMPVVERYQHPYWLTSYGQPPRGMTGLDAMVDIEDDWQLDMKFQNATDHWITVVLTADGVNVTAQIVGTDPGWNVAISDPKITNIVPKEEKMVYTDSEELPAGQELQVETAQDGFDVSIHRTVKKGDQLVDDVTLSSSFSPARNMTLRGKG